jgi:hypothetical protein
MFNSAARKATSLLDRARPRWGGGRMSDVIDTMKSRIERVEELTRETDEGVRYVSPVYG